MSDGGGGAPSALLDSQPSLESDVGSCGRGGGGDAEEPPPSVAVPRIIQNWPAWRLGCSSGGHFPGGSAGNVSSWVRRCGGSHWRGRPVACRVRSPQLMSPRSWRVVSVRRCGRESRRRARGTSRTERYMPFCGTRGCVPLQWCPRLPPHVGKRAVKPMLAEVPVLPLARAARSSSPCTARPVVVSRVMARWAMDHFRRLTYVDSRGSPRPPCEVGR